MSNGAMYAWGMGCFLLRRLGNASAFWNCVYGDGVRVNGWE